MSFVDAREIDDGTEVETDVCIIGAGAAGIAIANELLNQNRQVILLESGDRLPDSATQALCNGETDGLAYFPLAATRLRYFGGTTNHWTGVCRPLDPMDFTERSWVPMSGWPIDSEALDPYYRRAHEVCDLGLTDYSTGLWETDGAEPLPLDSESVRTIMYRLSLPTRFAQKYAGALEARSAVTTYLNGNAVRFEMGEASGAVRALEVACLSGTRFRIRAGLFVLATGAIENARMLLHNIENQALRLPEETAYWVGRCFMEHVSVSGGVFLPTNDRLGMSLYLERPSVNGITGYGALAPTPEAQRRERLLNCRVRLVPTTLREGVRNVAPGLVGAVVANQTGRLFDEFGEHVGRIAQELDELAIYSYERMFRPGFTRNGYYLFYHIEQAPNPESRVTLTGETDALGIGRPRLTWQLQDAERATLERMNELIAADIGAAGLGRVWDSPSDAATGWPAGLSGSWHQMGVTRMSADAGRGVVDANCRVHGTDNLYVAGSSVFTTCGHANPTLTLVALALRLADHIRDSAA